MEELNVLAADCIVISCCCQCLILQLLIFFLLKIPQKVVQKTREYAKERLQGRRREGDVLEMVKGGVEDAFWGLHRRSGSMQMEGTFQCCIEEVERVLEELSQKGEFSFGSFWGREASGSSSTSLDKHIEFDFSCYAQYEFN